MRPKSNTSYLRLVRETLARSIDPELFSGESKGAIAMEDRCLAELLQRESTDARNLDTRHCQGLGAFETGSRSLRSQAQNVCDPAEDLVHIKEGGTPHVSWEKFLRWYEEGGGVPRRTASMAILRSIQRHRSGHHQYGWLGVSVRSGKSAR